MEDDEEEGGEETGGGGDGREDLPSMPMIDLFVCL